MNAKNNYGTILEGEITERSLLPSPEKSDYPNCRFTAHFIGNSIISGEACPRELALVIEGFENYTIKETDNLKVGDKIVCSVFPFDNLSDEYKSTQIADDLNLFLLENYYVVDIHKINAFTDYATMPSSGIFFSNDKDNYISIFNRHINPPFSQKAKDAQKAAIQYNYNLANNLLKDYDSETIEKINELFSVAWNKEMSLDNGNYNRVGEYVWRNINESFWCLPEQ